MPCLVNAHGGQWPRRPMPTEAYALCPRRPLPYAQSYLMFRSKGYRTPDLGALRLGNTNVIRIGADRFGHFFRLGKSVGESLSPVVGNEFPWVFGDWIRSAIARF